MSRNDSGVFGQGEQACVDGVEDLVGIAAGEVGSADAAGKEGIAGENHLERFEVKADGSLGVAGSVDDVRGVIGDADDAAVGERFVGWGGFGSWNADPCGLFGHDFQKGKIIFVEIDGCAGEGFQLERSADVVDVGVSDEDLLQDEAEGGETAVDSGDFVAGVDHDSFASLFVGEDGAIALQRADGEGLEDHGFIVERWSKTREADR